MKHRVCRRGIMMVEILLTLTLFSAFALLATPVLNNSMRQMWKAEAEHNRILRSESLLQALRQDTWNASRVETIENGVLFIQPSGEIRWTIDSGTIGRHSYPSDEESAVRRWKFDEVSLEIVLSPEGATLIVKTADNETIERIPLTSQLILLGKASL